MQHDGELDARPLLVREVARFVRFLDAFQTFFDVCKLVGEELSVVHGKPVDRAQPLAHLVRIARLVRDGFQLFGDLIDDVIGTGGAVDHAEHLHLDVLKERVVDVFVVDFFCHSCLSFLTSDFPSIASFRFCLQSRMHSL